MSITLQSSPNTIVAVYNPIEYIWSTDINLDTHPDTQLKVEVRVNGVTVNGNFEYVDWVTISTNKRFVYDASEVLQTKINQSDNYDTIAFGFAQLQTEIVDDYYGILEYSIIVTERYQVSGVWTEFDSLTTSGKYANNTALAYGSTNDIDSYLLETGQIRSFLSNVPSDTMLRSTDEFHLSFLTNLTGKTLFISYVPYDLNCQALTRVNVGGIAWANGIQKGILPVNNNLFTAGTHSKIDVSIWEGANRLTEEKTFHVSQYSGNVVDVWWLNKLGGIDRYGVHTKIIESRKPNKVSYQNNFNRLVLSSKPDVEKSFYVPYVSQTIKTWLKELLDSPKVWLYDSGYDPVFIEFTGVVFDEDITEGFTLTYIEKPVNVQRG
jgi:hypothetical protein